MHNFNVIYIYKTTKPHVLLASASCCLKELIMFLLTSVSIDKKETDTVLSKMLSH